MYNKKLTLSNGVEIPQLGLGTQFIDDDKVADAVKAAADLGYRHFDTAQAYGNERGVGEGIRTCGIPREESLYPKLLQSIKLMKMPKQTYGKSDSSSHQQHSSGTC